MLSENVPRKIFIKDLKSVYVFCNELYAKDLGLKSEEITGKTDYEFFPKDLAGKYRADDKRVMSSGVAENIVEKYIVTKDLLRDTTEVIVHTVKTPLKDEKGKVFGILGIFWEAVECN
ncbi:MAG: PAS domain-containing protein [Candidatus Omnitrophica bacterium]|nr:PAS domain-containing protein [Candidatus Omnitrophota bacterium]